MDEKAFLDAVEYQLTEGGARWVADFPESIRQVRIGGTDFDMVARGSTRGKSGYFLSVFAARFTLPDYSVACVVKVVDKGGWDEQEIRRALAATQNFMEKNELRWTWLVLAQPGEPSRAATRVVEGISSKETGVALVNLDNQRAVHSSNLLGRNVHRILPHGRRQAISRERWVEPGPKSPIQKRYLMALFGGFLIALMLLSGLAVLLLTGSFLIPLNLFLGDLVVAAILAYIFYVTRYHLDFIFDEEKFRLVRGTDNFLEAKWADYDMVSLFHTGGGRYQLTLYRRGDHDKYIDIPASTVRLDPLAFRWKAMELTAHGKGNYPTL